MTFLKSEVFLRGEFDMKIGPLRRISILFMRRISYENIAKLQEKLIQQVSKNIAT
jgi:hypothetical protein